MSTRPHHHRRRSHSTSSPLTSPRHIDADKWRASLKRARPNTLSGPSYKDLLSDQLPQKWDVEIWRRGKRPRRSTSVRFPCQPPLQPASIFSQENNMSVDEVPRFAPSSPPVFRDTPTPPSKLPSTSDAFHFFPSRPKVSNRLAQSPSIPSHPPSQDIDRLRSDAFCELHRTVAESGEGLVRRMRDWEGSQSAASAARPTHARTESPRARNHYVPHTDFTWTSSVTDDSEEDELDIQIMPGDSPCPGTFAHWGPPHKKRALSMSVMEVDHTSLDDIPSTFVSPESSERCSSPVDPSVSETSAFTSDDESPDIPMLGPSFLSPPYTLNNSANSSLMSLPLHPPSLNRSHSHSGTYHIPSTASREEKAIAALTLAMANGAAGINDYSDIRLLEDNAPLTMDQSLVGELWD
ncbi:hypothetical protein NLI96_g2833 [Meripilus lineatus]|uniref:Uncharacterized protein n=1 Tax=Meripilus lineatus TaxID=2056292 RepID=A0AAD5YH71_9APHY|nr:hypothetical protein NLI96_g2833 [Physisporinus lineatus]